MRKFDPKSIADLARRKEKINRDLIRALKKKAPGILSEWFREAHDDVFSRIGCLECANCCRTLGPRITGKDIERLSSYLKMKPSVFIQSYLRVDEDKDFVFREMPCPFLLADNSCSVYEKRPKACREYPHTDVRMTSRMLELSLVNASVCPAVIEILDSVRIKQSG